MVLDSNSGSDLLLRVVPIESILFFILFFILFY